MPTAITTTAFPFKETFLTLALLFNLIAFLENILENIVSENFPNLQPTPDNQNSMIIKYY